MDTPDGPESWILGQMHTAGWRAVEGINGVKNRETLRTSVLARVSERSRFQAERAGLNQARFYNLLKRLYLRDKYMSSKDLDSLKIILKQHGFLLSRTEF